MQKVTDTKKVTNTKKRISKINNSTIDMPLLIVVLMLLALGIVMVLSASAPSALADYQDSYRYVKTQGIAALLGIFVMFVLSKIDYRRYKKYYKIIYVFSILVLFTVLIPKLGVEVNGAKRWIQIARLRIQPSEITKIGLILSFAGYYTDDKNKLDTWVGSILIPLIGLAIPVGLLLLIQNHLSAGIVISFITVVMVFMSGIRLKYITNTLMVGITSVVLMLPVLGKKLSGSFRSDRIEAWLHPMENSSGTAYQTMQGLYAIGSGGLFGAGLGQSKQKYLYIPEAHNDFIFAIIAEELGFVGCLFVLVLFTIFAIRGILIAINAQDLYGSLIAMGITSLIIVQAILNIAVVTNTIPNTGISLPFLSYGGSSVIILLSCVGILLNISRSSKKI